MVLPSLRGGAPACLISSDVPPGHHRSSHSRGSLPKPFAGCPETHPPVPRCTSATLSRTRRSRCCRMRCVRQEISPVQPLLRPLCDGHHPIFMTPRVSWSSSSDTLPPVGLHALLPPSDAVPLLLSSPSTDASPAAGWPATLLVSVAWRVAAVALRSPLRCVPAPGSLASHPPETTMPIPAGFAFVQFEDPRDAEDAVTGLAGKNGWRVEVARPPRARDDRFGGGPPGGGDRRWAGILRTWLRRVRERWVSSSTARCCSVNKPLARYPP